MRFTVREFAAFVENEVVEVEIRMFLCDDELRLALGDGRVFVCINAPETLIGELLSVQASAKDLEVITGMPADPQYIPFMMRSALLTHLYLAQERGTRFRFVFIEESLWRLPQRRCNRTPMSVLKRQQTPQGTQS